MLFEDFIVNFAADFLAGLFALLLGIPVGLWLDRHIQKRNTAALQQTIFGSLRDEILFNIRRMMDALALYGPEGSGRGLINHPSNTIWKTITTGEGLRAIDDQQLLRLCLSLYRMVDLISDYIYRLDGLKVKSGDSKDYERRTKVIKTQIASASREGIDLSLMTIEKLDGYLNISLTTIDGLAELLMSWDSQ